MKSLFKVYFSFGKKYCRMIYYVGYKSLEWFRDCGSELLYVDCVLGEVY